MSLVGIARLAAQSTPLDSKRSVEYRRLPTRSWISRCSNPRMPFDWMINPYRGCEFACKYCYARYTHEFMELRDPEDFETRIFAKHFHPAPFRAELARIRPQEAIAIGTATDPYQPAERRYGLTRRLLGVFAEERGRRLSITTKSDLVARDAGLLALIARRNTLHVNLTVTTLDAGLARLIEPRAPRPDLRLSALARLRQAGIRAGVLCSPVLPLLNDSYESLSALGEAAAQAGSDYFGGGVLFLKPCSRQVFLPFLEQRFPRLAERYKHHYGTREYLRGPYPEAIEGRMERVRKETGLARGPAYYLPEDGADPQGALFPVLE